MRLPDELWTGLLAEVSALDRLMMGLLAYDAGDRDRAELAWSQALASSDPTVRATAAISLAVLQREAAVETQDTARRQQLLDRALELLEEGRQAGSEPESPRAERLLGDLLTELGRHDQAAAAYRRAMNSLHPDEAPRATWRAGLLRLEQDDTEGARELLEAAVASDHYDVAPRAALDLARLLLHEAGQGGSGDRQAPIEALELATRRGAPDVARAAGRRLAGVLQQPADPSRALQALTDATGSGDPTVASVALRRLGAAEALKLADELAAAGDVGRAETAYRLIADWEDQRVERARAAHRLAVLVAGRDPEGARAYFSLAVANATGPADRELLARAQLGLAMALQRLGDPVAGIRAYRDTAGTLGLVIPHLLSSGDDPHGGRYLPEFHLAVTGGLLQAYEQVIDEGLVEDIPEAAERLARHHVGRRDRRALDDLVGRVVALADRTTAEKTSLRLAQVFNDANLPEQELAVHRFLAGSSDSSVARMGQGAAADLERQLKLPRGRAASSGSLPEPSPRPPIDPGDGPSSPGSQG